MHTLQLKWKRLGITENLADPGDFYANGVFATNQVGIFASDATANSG